MDLVFFEEDADIKEKNDIKTPVSQMANVTMLPDHVCRHSAGEHRKKSLGFESTEEWQRTAMLRDFDIQQRE